MLCVNHATTPATSAASILGVGTSGTTVGGPGSTIGTISAVSIAAGT